MQFRTFAARLSDRKEELPKAFNYKGDVHTTDWYRELDLRSELRLQFNIKPKEALAYGPERIKT